MSKLQQTIAGDKQIEWQGQIMVTLVAEKEIKWSFFSGGRQLPSPSKRTTVLFFIAMKIRNDELQINFLVIVCLFYKTWFDMR